MNGESLFLVSHCFAGLVQRIFNRNKIQENSLAPDKLLNILIYRSPFCVITYTSYKLVKML